ncbi:MAG TPA: IS1380 family transposase [Geminicoccaceae bacterium]|nr:IS1380 family transposase [Geminicoccaceae bacterium]
MAEGALVLPGSSSIAGKGVRVAFDGGCLTSDAGVLVLAEIERRLGIAERLARCIEDPRAPERVHHTLTDMIRFRVLLIAAGYPDANDCDALRADPAFKMAVGRAPESERDLCSQPSMSRLENLPTATALKRMMAAMVGLFCDSFTDVPRRIVLDIDDTEDRVHGRQQLSLFHAHYDSRCFLPIHVYEAISGKPVAVILRPGKTPDGAEVALVLRHVIRRIRARWPKVDILVRGDSHYGRHEAMTWCERERVGYMFGLAGNKVLSTQVAGLAEGAAVSRIESEVAKVRRYGEFRYAAKTWHVERRVIARVEASDRGTDSRFVVTNLRGTRRWLYEVVYCARGQAENLVKAHKRHLASDRTSCTRATANQFRLVLHTAAYWLLHTLRSLAPKRSFWREAQFDTLRLMLIKVAARVTELATRIKLALPSSYPYRNSFTLLAARAARPP